MTGTQTVELAAWLTRIWDEDTRRFSGHEEDCDEQFRRPCDCMYGEMLARIAADREILELHKPQPVQSLDRTTFLQMYMTCYQCRSRRRRPEWPCETVRLLASPYKGREGWQEEWDE